MDMNFPHDALLNEPQNDMIDLNAIRSSIIASASARQAGCETVRKLQKANDNITYSNFANSISPLKSRIIFFAKPNKFAHDDFIHEIVKGSFFPKNDSDFNIVNNYESVVNLNNSNSVKSSSVIQDLTSLNMSHHNKSQSKRG